MKADPRRLIRAHYATLVDNRTGRARVLDHLAFEGAPAVVVVGSLLIGVALPKPASVGLLTVAGLLSAFFFGAMLQVSERAMGWADKNPGQGPATSRQAIFLGQISANAGYASMVSILTAAVFVVASVVHDTALNIFSALGLGLAVHVALMLLMVTSRVYNLTQERLTDARTGRATVTQLPGRKAS